MGFGRLSFTTETASACIIDSMRGYNTRGDAGRCCIKALSSPRMSRQVNGDWKYCCFSVLPRFSKGQGAT